MAIPFDFQPILIGEAVRLRPLKALDFEALYTVASDPLIWEQNPEPTRYQRKVFETFFKGAIDSKGALIVEDLENNKVLGSSRYHSLNLERSEVIVGFTFLRRSHWGGKYNGEMKKLMIDHAFKYVKTVKFRIGERNLRSRKAIEKIGAKLVGPEPVATLGGQIHFIYSIERQGSVS